MEMPRATATTKDSGKGTKDSKPDSKGNKYPEMMVSQRLCASTSSPNGVVNVERAALSHTSGEVSASKEGAGNAEAHSACMKPTCPNKEAVMHRGSRRSWVLSLKACKKASSREDRGEDQCEGEHGRFFIIERAFGINCWGNIGELAQVIRSLTPEVKAMKPIVKSH